MQAHIFRQLVNDLRGIATQFHGHDSLRDRISGRLREDIQPDDPATQNADRPTKRKPTGFVAICQCGVIVGAMDSTRTERHEAGQILSRWLADGRTVDPRFTGDWQAHIEHCQCQKPTPERQGWGMTPILNYLITGAIQLAGDNLTSHNAKLWKSIGGRTCPIGWGGCSQPVFEDLKTGEVDYGEPGGPGHQDCVCNCLHGMTPPPAPDDDDDEDQPPKNEDRLTISKAYKPFCRVCRPFLWAVLGRLVKILVKVLPTERTPDGRSPERG